MNKKFLWLIPAFLLLIVLFNCFFVLNENESAIIKRFGSIEAVYMIDVTDAVKEGIARTGKFATVKLFEGAGLKLKIPFIDQVVKYSRQLLTYDTQPRQVITADKKKLIFDNNAQWRIANPLLFDITMGSIPAAQRRIDDILYSRMNEEVGKVESSILISDKKVNNGMLDKLASDVSRDLSAYGIEVFDIRIKRTDLPEENYQSIYNRMITERERIASQYRSEGEEESIKIKSNTDMQVAIIVSEAKADAERIRGEGDAQAARIYNDAYGATPDFFTFYNTILAYQETLGSQTTLMLPYDSPFAQFLLNLDETGE